MGPLTTHVLDTMNGCPAAGMRVRLYRIAALEPELLHDIVLDADGRSSIALLPAVGTTPGRYRLLFDVAGYFRSRGVLLPDPPFLDAVPVDFGIADTASHYHVPLLVTPWTYATYRGS